MNLATATPTRRQFSDWVRLQAAYCLPGALLALALTLPMYRKLLLWHRGPEEIYYELRDGFAYLSDIPTLIAFAAWMATPFRRRIRDLPWWLTATLAALALLGTLSALWAPMPSTALYHSARLWLLLALYLIIATTPEARGALMWGIVLSGALQAAIGIAQFAHQATFGLTELGEVIVRPEWSGASVITVGGRRILRAYGLTQHPNVLGGVLAIATLAGVGLVLSQRGLRSSLAIGLTALSFAGLLFSFSRAAWVGLTAGGLVGLLFLVWLHLRSARTPGLAPVTQQAATSAPTRRTRGLAPVAQQAATSGGGRRLGGLLGILFTIGLLFAVTQWSLLRPRLGLAVEGVEIRSVDERAVLEASAWTLIREQPWLGVGYANFAMALLLRQPEALAAYPIYQPVHRVPLLAAAELGIAGVAIWLIMAAGPWVTIWVRRRTWPPADTDGLIAVCAAAALAALTVISWFDFYPWYGQPGRLLTWIMLALWAQSLVPKKPVRQKPGFCLTSNVE